MDKESFKISQTYDLVGQDSTAIQWVGDNVRVVRPYGLSNISTVQFREFKGEMLPFTKQNLPQLKCTVSMNTKKITNANVDGESNPWTGSRFIVSNVTASNITSFSKAWTYSESEDFQIIYNLNECISMANDRLKTIFPKLDDAYVWTNDGVFKHLVDESIHLSRANAGSGAVGLISKNSNQVQIYNGDTTYPLDVDYMCTSTMTVGDEKGVRQCFSNYNNSIVIIDGSDMWKPVNNQELTRYNIFFNSNTADAAIFNEYSTWTYGSKTAIVEGRCNGSVFAIVRDEDDKAYNAVMTSVIYQYTSLVLSGPTLWVADPTATNKYRKVTITKSDWVDFLTNCPLAISTSIYCQVLAFNTIYDDAETKLYLYCLCATVEGEYSQNAYYILFRCEVDIINETHGTLEFIASQAITAANFKASLSYHYQYGADVGEMLIETTADEGDYYNFGFKYACKVDGTILDVKVLRSCILDVDSDNNRLYYLCETKEHDGQAQATIAVDSPKDLYDNGGIDGPAIEQTLHAYYLLCDRGNNLENPYDCVVKGWLRNLSDDHWNFNNVLLGALDQYYLGSSNETDTVRNISSLSYVNMSLSSSTPSVSIWNAITRDSIDYATVSEDFSDYYTASLSLDDRNIVGQCTRPTLILKDSDDEYYQISFILRIYTDPYYFELYTDAHEFAVPSGAYSLMFGPVDWIYKQLNPHVLTTLEMMITMQYEFNDLILKCSTFPNIDNVVFSINEASRVRFKMMSVDSTINSLILSVEDKDGNKIDRDTLARLYGSLIVSLDWVQ